MANHRPPLASEAPGAGRHVFTKLAEGKVDASPIVAGTVGFVGVESAFEALGDPQAHAKILIDPASPGDAP